MWSDMLGWQLSWIQFIHSVVHDSLQPHGLQHTRLLCPSPTPGACSISCPLSRWCHPTISSSVIPLSSCLQSFPASGFFFFSPVSEFSTSGGQVIGASASASVLLKNIQDWWKVAAVSRMLHQDSWPPEERILIRGQRQGLTTWSFLCSKVLLKYNTARETSDIDIRRG